MESLQCWGRSTAFKKAVVFGNEVPITVTSKYQRLKLKVLFEEHAKTQFRE